MLLKAEEINDF